MSVLAIQPGSHARMAYEAAKQEGGLPPFRWLGRSRAEQGWDSADAAGTDPWVTGSASIGLSDRSKSDVPKGPSMSSSVRADGAVTSDSDKGAGSRERAGDREGGSFGSLVAELARDAASLAGHPRRTARALRLAVYARRAAALVPAGTVRIHAHFANDAAALARYVSALTGIPYRVTAHAYDLYQDPFLLRANLAGAERVYTVARANLEDLLARAASEGWDPARFSVLRCGIDLAEFPYRDPLPSARPARLLSVARLVPKKGLLTLLDAVARIGRAAAGAGGAGRTSGAGAAGGAMNHGAPDVHLTIAGDGPQAGEIAARAAAPDLAGRVTLLGAVPPPRVRDLMRASDLFVLAARIAEDGDRDGLPVSIIEAMALGLPVLATAVAGIPELVTERTGRLVPPGRGHPTEETDHAGTLADAIRDALAEAPQRRAELARSARRQVESEFDLALQVAALRP